MSETTGLTAKLPSSLPMLEFRRSVRTYLTAVGLVMLLLLITAWSIDLADNFAAVRDKASERGVALASVLAPYLLYRSVDILDRLLPIAAFVGFFLSELMRRRRLESIIFSAAGFSPVQGLAAAAAVGLAIGGLQFALETYWRPAAVFAQVDLGVGSYARRFKRGLTDDVNWFLSNDDALSAQVLRDDRPELRRIELYRGYRDDRLREVVVAERAEPIGDASNWRLYNAVIWKREGTSASYTSTRQATLDVDFKLLPDQLTYLDIPAFYLPNAALSAISGMPTAPNIADVDLAIWRRWTALFLPSSFALLGAGLAQMVWTGRVLSPMRGLALGLCGYAAIVSTRVFWSLGEYGAMPASLAASLTIVLALAGVVVIQLKRY